MTQVSVIAIANGNEANGSPAIFRFSRTGSTTDPLSVSYRLLGTAQAGSDYSGATTGTISFSAGSAIAELSLPALADSVVDPGETIIAQIVPSPTATPSYSITPGQQTATATITAEGMVVTVNGPSRPGWSKGEYGNTGAFAAIRGDGSVVTWGSSFYGSDSSGVAGQLGYGITQIFSTESAFAALKSDGSVVTWGSSFYGGDSSGVAGQLSSGVTQVFASRYAFAALKGDGSVVTWGESWSGGNSNGVAGQLSSGVTQIFSTNYAFAALKGDGSVVTWDSITFGGVSSGVAGQLSSGVTQIFSTSGAFAALKSDGSVVTWGYGPWGGDSSGVASRLSSGITKVSATVYAFAALKGDGSIVTWGDSSYGSDSSGVAGQLSSGVTQIFFNAYSFAALKADGSVVTWGQGSYGGDSSAVAAKLSSGVTQIFSTNNAFAALKGDGSVVTWGLDPWGGNSNGVADQLRSGVTQIFSTNTAFAALKGDGSVVTWGDSTGGAKSNGVAGQLSSGVTQIFTTGSAFAALKGDGSVVTWGNGSYGGDSSGVAGQLNNIVAFANPFSDDRLEVFAEVLPSITLLAGSPASAREDGDTNLLFIFIRTGRTDRELTVNYTVGGTATLGIDYTGIAELPTTNVITFAAGSATATLVIDPIADSEIEADETVSLTLAAGTGYTIITSTAVTGTIVTVNVVCFLAGTLIATLDGERPIETLKPGDLISTAEGPQPVRFLARSTRSIAQLQALGKMPIRINQGALGSLGPAQDTFLSPSHAIHFAGCLVEAGALINGTSIQQLNDWPDAALTYYNIELERHGLITANNLLVESYFANYRSNGFSRDCWDNYRDYVALYGTGELMKELPIPRIPFARQIPMQLRLTLQLHEDHYKAANPAIAASGVDPFAGLCL